LDSNVKKSIGKKQKMEKKYYYAPEVKFHQLKAKAAMLAGSESEGEGPQDDTLEAKGFGSFSFDEDED
jgi:hypothetical protein